MKATMSPGCAVIVWGEKVNWLFAPTVTTIVAAEAAMAWAKIVARRVLSFMLKGSVVDPVDYM